jgi:hypothetical protein
VVVNDVVDTVTVIVAGLDVVDTVTVIVAGLDVVDTVIVLVAGLDEIDTVSVAVLVLSDIDMNVVLSSTQVGLTTLVEELLQANGCVDSQAMAQFGSAHDAAFTVPFGNGSQP